MSAQLEAEKEVTLLTGNVERSGGRPAAGQDPAKRQQIIDGAKRCFLELGFEAASMNDITAEAARWAVTFSRPRSGAGQLQG